MTEHLAPVTPAEHDTARAAGEEFIVRAFAALLQKFGHRPLILAALIEGMIEGIVRQAWTSRREVRAKPATIHKPLRDMLSRAVERIAR